MLLFNIETVSYKQYFITQSQQKDPSETNILTSLKQCFWKEHDRRKLSE